MNAVLTQEQRLALLLRTVQWAEEKTDFYRAAFARAGVCHTSVKSFADMARLPFWERTAREGADAPFFMLTLPLSGVLRVSALDDGAAGWLHCYTQGDVARHVVATREMLASCGLNRASTVLLVGDFTDSRTLDLQYGLEGLGAAVLPCASDAGVVFSCMRAAVPDTVIVWEPWLPVLAAVPAGGVHRLVTVGGHPAPSASARETAARIGARHAHLFTLPQMGAIIGHTCSAGAGMHLEERLFFAEVVDDAGQSCTADGAHGMLVLSTLAAEAMPVLRYQTGISVRLAHGRCTCGSTHLRITEE